MEEAIRSSQLEGASTTRSIAKDMIRTQRFPRDKSERMILNNYLAMERIEEFAKAPLDSLAVFELHQVLTDGTLDDPSKAGVFRTDGDQIVVELIHSVRTAHVPPPAAELQERLDRLLAFANGETPSDWLHPIIRAAILHFTVGYDHPFVDGNGRVARALFYWCLVRHGYPLAKYLSISKVLRDAPARYQEAYLLTETDAGDLTYFVDHQLEVVSRSIRELEDYVGRKVSDTWKVERALSDSDELNHRQIKLLSHAIRNPGHEYTVRSHEKSHRVATNTARSDLMELAEIGLLLQAKRGRKFIFLSPKDLRTRLEDFDSA